MRREGHKTKQLLMGVHDTHLQSAMGTSGRRSRLVQVRVLDGENEVDGFTASDPDILRDVIAPICRHLSPRERIEFQACEFEKPLLRSSRLCSSGSLKNLSEALAFLTWDVPVVNLSDFQDAQETQRCAGKGASHGGAEPRRGTEDKVAI